VARRRGHLVGMPAGSPEPALRSMFGLPTLCSRTSAGRIRSGELGQLAEVLRGSGKQELVLGSRSPTPTQAIELEDAFEMGEL
jgi:hypothetical protein